MLRDVQSFVSGTPRLILRLEGFCLLAGSLWAFQVQHGGWTLFAVCLEFIHLLAQVIQLLSKLSHVLIR